LAQGEESHLSADSFVNLPGPDWRMLEWRLPVPTQPELGTAFNPHKGPPSGVSNPGVKHSTSWENLSLTA